VTEGLIIACAIMIGCGLFGNAILSEPLTNFIGLSNILGKTTMLDLWLPMLLGSLLIAVVPGCVYNVVRARRKHNLPILPVFLEWTPMLIYTGSLCAWLGSPHTTLLRQGQRLVLMCLTMSFVFGRMTTKIILAHLTRQPFPYWTVLLWPLVGGALLANMPLLGLPALTEAQELAYLRAYFVLANVVYFRWATLVINSICEYLGINCLSITHKPAPGQREELARPEGIINEEHGRKHGQGKKTD
jgi:ethanolaminephosphotransferase